MRTRSGDLEALPVAGEHGEHQLTAPTLAGAVATEGGRRRWPAVVVALTVIGVVLGPIAWEAAGRSAARRLDAVWAGAQALDRERSRQLRAMSDTYLFDDRPALSAAQARTYAEVARRTRALRARASSTLALHADVRRARGAVVDALALRVTFQAGVVRYLRTSDARALDTNEGDVRRAEASAVAAMDLVRERLRIRTVTAPRPRIAAAKAALAAATRYLDHPTRTRLALAGADGLTVVDIDASTVASPGTSRLGGVESIVAIGPTLAYTRRGVVVRVHDYESVMAEGHNIAEDGDRFWVQQGWQAAAYLPTGARAPLPAEPLPVDSYLVGATSSQLVLQGEHGGVLLLDRADGRLTALGLGRVLATTDNAVAWLRATEGSESHTLHLWRAGKDRTLLEIAPGRFAAAVSPDGATLAVDTPSPTLISLDSGKRLPAPRRAGTVAGDGWAMTFSPDGHWVFVLRARVDQKTHIEAWDLRRRRVQRVRLVGGEHHAIVAFR